MTNPIGAVLVAGAGTGGVWPSLDLAATGLDVYLPNENLAIDATMARSDNTLPTNDYTMCIPSPKPMGAAAARASWSTRLTNRGS